MANVDIANEALIRLGAATITTLTDGSANATLINSIFGDTRDMLVAGHPWSWAVTRADLVSNASTNYTDWSYMYDVPSALRLLSLYTASGSSSGEKWFVEGTYLYTNQVSAMMSYIQSISDTDTMSVPFKKALGARIAFEICLRITQNMTLRDRLFREYNYELLQAKIVDGAVAKSDEEEPRLWTSAR